MTRSKRKPCLIQETCGLPSPFYDLCRSLVVFCRNSEVSSDQRVLAHDLYVQVYLGTNTVFAASNIFFNDRMYEIRTS